MIPIVNTNNLITSSKEVYIPNQELSEATLRNIEQLNTKVDKISTELNFISQKFDILNKQSVIPPPPPLPLPSTSNTPSVGNLCRSQYMHKTSERPLLTQQQIVKALKNLRSLKNDNGATLPIKTSITTESEKQKSPTNRNLCRTQSLYVKAQGKNSKTEGSIPVAEKVNQFNKKSLESKSEQERNAEIERAIRFAEKVNRFDKLPQESKSEQGKNSKTEGSIPVAEKVNQFNKKSLESKSEQERNAEIERAIRFAEKVNQFNELSQDSN